MPSKPNLLFIFFQALDETNLWDNTIDEVFLPHSSS